MNVNRLATLAEPLRRRLHEALLDADGPVTAPELAARLGISRTLTAFHLARLVEVGLVLPLAPEPAHGRGRPAQRFRTSDAEITASVPVRRYDLVAEILLEATSTLRSDESMEDAAARAAHETGHRLAESEPAAGRSSPMRRMERLLQGLGYRPKRRAGEIVLHNCPFAKLREPHLTMVCGINHGLARGYLDGLGLLDVLAADLRPTDNCCCVVVRTR